MCSVEVSPLPDLRNSDLADEWTWFKVGRPPRTRKLDLVDYLNPATNQPDHLQLVWH